jgi:4-hydroxybenzoate polyprenyltransferase
VPGHHRGADRPGGPAAAAGKAAAEKAAAGEVLAGQVTGLLRAAHLGPGLAVTVLAGLLALSTPASAGRAHLVVLAYATGQLSVGWGNDLVDADRDRLVGRADKPIATGAVSPALVRAAIAVALAACVVASLALGPAAGLAHLLLGVAAGWAYNAGLKGTAASWLPYAVAFGTLPLVVALAGSPPTVPPVWMIAAGALLGVGAHVVNVLPDLADDAATGVHGLPHRLGERLSRWLAVAALVTASAVVALAPSAAGRPVPAWVWAALVAVSVLAAVALRARGKVPFWAAVAIAAVDVVMLLLRG